MLQTAVSDLRDPRGGELGDVLDWGAMVSGDPGIMSTKTGRLQTSYHARFADTEQMEREERAWYLSRIDEVMRLLGEGCALDNDWWHEPTTAYPETDWDARDAPRSDRLVDGLRYTDVKEHPRHTSQLTVTLSWRPPPLTRQLLRNFFVTKGSVRQVSAKVRSDIAVFEDGTLQFLSALLPLLDDLTPLDADGLCTYLHQSVSWDRHAVLCPDPAYDLDWQLTSALWRPGRPPMVDEMLVQPLTIKTWNRKIRTMVINALSTMPFPCRYHVRWEPKGLRTADAFLTWAEKRWATGYRGAKKLFSQMTSMDEATEVEGRDEQDSAKQAGQSIIDLRRAVRQGRDIVGKLSPTVICWAETPEDLQTRVMAVADALFQQGLVVRVERGNASIQYLASLPGHVAYGIRGRVLSTPFLTAMMPHHHRWTGPARDVYLDDEPLFVASSDGVPFNVVTHVGDLGGVLIAGPSRTGKSGLMGFATRQSFRYRGTRNATFDRDEQLKAVTLLRGGQHYRLGSGDGPRLQPLGDLESPDQCSAKAIWVEQVLTGEGLAPTPEERREILRMIGVLARRPRQERTLSLARKLLQVPRLKVGLEPFCEGGEYAFCDGNSNPFDWHNRHICFEMKDLVGKPRALQATLSYCFQELEAQWFTGDPVYVMVDEVKWLLDIEHFLGEFGFWLKARAKKNVSVWAATQELYDVQQTKVWQAILANMLVRFLLPNPQAMSASVRPFYEDLQVPNWAIRQLTTAQPYRDYLYSSPLGTRMFQCRLSPVERLLCAASRPDELEVLDELAQQYSPEELPAAWLRYWGYPEEATYLDPVTTKGEVCTVPSLPQGLASSLVLPARSFISA